MLKLTKIAVHVHVHVHVPVHVHVLWVGAVHFKETYPSLSNSGSYENIRRSKFCKGCKSLSELRVGVLTGTCSSGPLRHLHVAATPAGTTLVADCTATS